MFAENNGKLQIRPAAAGQSVKIAIAGDVCPHKDAEDYLLAGNADKLLAGIKPALDDADLRIVQWETVISDTPAPITNAVPTSLSNPVANLSSPQATSISPSWRTTTPATMPVPESFPPCRSSKPQVS